MGLGLSIGVLGTLVWSFFNPLWASTIFLLVFVLALEGYIFLMSIKDRPHHLEPFSDPFNLNPDEANVVKKYHLFFKFPMASQQFSAAISLIQISTLVWVPWLIYSKLWIAAIAIAINYFIAERLAMQLNPRLFMHRRLKGPFFAGTALKVFNTASTELIAIDSAFEKLHKYDERLHNANHQ